MITSIIPAHQIGGISPALLLDFTSGSLDSRVTFTRTGSASRVNASGLVESVSADTARFDYDPVTLACKGLLIEVTRENVITNSANWNAASWSTFVNGSATISRTANAGTAPDGTSTATQIDFNATGSDQAFVFSNVFAITSGQLWAGSF